MKTITCEHQTFTVFTRDKIVNAPPKGKRVVHDNCSTVYVYAGERAVAYYLTRKYLVYRLVKILHARVIK